MNIKNPLKSNLITVLFLILGTGFLLFGIWREEYTIVMEKSITICLECVGIG